MTLEKQVVNLELSKKLKSLGVKQKSSFYWFRHPIDKKIMLSYGRLSSDKIYSAFTVAELGEMLPRGYMSFHDSLGNWYCEHLDIFIKTSYRWKFGNIKTEANARAKCLIYLLENKLIKL